jgi:hypothetical protein
MYDILYISQKTHDPELLRKFLEQYPYAIVQENVSDLLQALEIAQKVCMTEMFWIVTEMVEIHKDLNFSWKPDTWDMNYAHVWRTEQNYLDRIDGIYLVPTGYELSANELLYRKINNLKLMYDPDDYIEPFEIFICSKGNSPTLKDRLALELDKPVTWISTCDTIASAVSKIPHVHSDMYWLITDDAVVPQVEYLQWRPPLWDRTYVHGLRHQTDGRDADLYLIPSGFVPSQDELANGYITPSKLIPLEPIGSVPFDIFFISYHEPNADHNWEQLARRFPHARRINGIKGISKAHKRCAEESTTEMFWTVDADTTISDDFEFDYRPPSYDRQYLHLWLSQNPVNGLVYGYGAVKLWPTDSVKSYEGKSWLDYTTSVGNLKMMEGIAGVSQFNCDEYNSWKSGFREAVKLCYNIAYGDLEESLDRLWTWTNVRLPVSFADDAVQGSRDGIEFYLSAGDEDSGLTLQKINDFEWLQRIYAHGMHTQSTGYTKPELLRLLRRETSV